jgi:hypothetical protein
MEKRRRSDLSSTVGINPTGLREQLAAEIILELEWELTRKGLR